MDGSRAQSKIFRGMGKAAQRIGLSFDLYRPAGATNPLAAGNKVATLPAHFTANGGYKSPNTYGQATWQAMLDGSQVAVGDYLTGTGGPYFIAAKQPLLPILAVGCNRTVSVTQGPSPVAVGWPASVLQAGGGRRNPLESVANDPSGPSWTMLLPAVSGAALDVADLVTDDLLRSYFIDSAELTDLGWRVVMRQALKVTDSIIAQYPALIALIGKTVTFRKIAKTGPAQNPVLTPTDYTVKALVAAYDTALIDGALITVKDLRIIMGTTATSGSPIPTPTATDFIGIDGAFRSVGVSKPLYTGPSVAVYDVQAKG